MTQEQPIEVFSLQLARLMKRRDWRILRGLSADDKDEVIARALLIAWEERDRLDTERGTVEVWFNFILRRARQEWAEEINKDANCVEQLECLAVESANPELLLETEQDTAAFFESLSTEEATAIKVLSGGGSIREASDESGLHQRNIAKLRRRALRIGAQPRRALPSDRVPRGLAEDRTDKPSNIDKEIAAWLKGGFHRVTGLCAPCVHCAWYDGYSHNPLAPQQVVDPEVAQAIADTLARKIKIAKGLTDES